MANIYLILNK